MKKQQQGRSMIEMLGVLGIMAVITVLAITAYRMAYRNSKMNDLKQDVASISQQLGKVYSNQRYTDEGVVLGEDKTFENLFIDTKMFKSSTTPFGGTYELSAISNDLFELKITGVETEDCTFIISDDSIIKKFPELSISCEDVSGLEYFSSNNTNSSDYISPEVKEMLDNYSSKELYNKCISGTKVACDALAEDPNATGSQLVHACFYTDYSATSACEASMKKEDVPAHMVERTCVNNEEACKSLVESGDAGTAFIAKACLKKYIEPSACESILERDNYNDNMLSEACQGSSSKSICDTLADYEGVSTKNLYSSCNASSNEKVCDTLAEDPNATASQLVHACFYTDYSATSACEASMKKEGVPAHMVERTCVNNEEACKSLVESGDAGTAFIAKACLKKYVESSSCESILERDNYNDNMLSEACQGSSSKSICDTLADYEGVSTNNLYSSCNASSNEKVCDTLAEDPNATGSQLVHSCFYTNYSATSACEASMKKEDVPSHMVERTCINNKDACKSLVESGDAGAAFVEKACSLGYVDISYCN